MGSAPWKIDFDDFWQVVVTALVAAAIAFGTYIVEHADSAGLGVYAPIIVMVVTAGLKFLRQWQKDNTKK